MSANKTCSRCTESKSVDQFHADKRRKDGYRSACKQCMKASHNTEKAKEYWLVKNFNITVSQYNVMLANQNYLCAGCGVNQKDEARAFAVDHDHNCCPDNGRSCGKCIRGLLCFKCNATEARFTVEELMGLVAYKLQCENVLGGVANVR